MNSDSYNIDANHLASYLQSKIEGFAGPLTVEKFAGGQSNPTFLINAASGRYVLRRQPTGKLLKSAHAIDREYRVLRALAGTDVPVARTYHLCEDPAIIGSLFYVMSYEQGQFFWEPSLPAIAREQRADYVYELVRILAAIHSVDVNAVGLGDFGRPGNFYERQIGLWTKQYLASETERRPAMEALMDWLQKHCPTDDGRVCLVHGDYRLDNVMFVDGEPRSLAVLDWELSTLGHPLADLAYFCMCLRLPAGGHIPGLGGINRADVGVPSEEDIVRRYCELCGLDGIDNWHFYLAFAYFRIAAIAQGVLKRAQMGNASNEKAVAVGGLVGPLVDMALATIGEATPNASTTCNMKQNR